MLLFLLLPRAVLLRKEAADKQQQHVCVCVCLLDRSYIYMHAQTEWKRTEQNWAEQREIFRTDRQAGRQALHFFRSFSFWPHIFPRGYALFLKLQSRSITQSHTRTNVAFSQKPPTEWLIRSGDALFPLSSWYWCWLAGSLTPLFILSSPYLFLFLPVVTDTHTARFRSISHFRMHLRVYFASFLPPRSALFSLA